MSGAFCGLSSGDHDTLRRLPSCTVEMRSSAFGAYIVVLVCALLGWILTLAGNGEDLQHVPCVTLLHIDRLQCQAKMCWACLLFYVMGTTMSHSYFGFCPGSLTHGTESPACVCTATLNSVCDDSCRYYFGKPSYNHSLLDLQSARSAVAAQQFQKQGGDERPPTRFRSTLTLVLLQACRGGLRGLSCWSCWGPSLLG